MRVVTVAQMRAAERAAAARGITEATLQARAGAAVAEVVQRWCPHGPVLVLAGRGNNGRDGWVAARWLQRRGRFVSLYTLPGHAIAAQELAALVADGGRVHLHAGESDRAVLEQWLGAASVVLDGLLGIGVRGAPRSPLAEVIALLNSVVRARRGEPRVVAIDVPSGIDADSGAVPGEAVQAHATVALGAVKLGLLRFPAAARVGALLAGDIGLPCDLLPDTGLTILTRARARAAVPARPLDGHKGTFGRVLVCAGSSQYYGAAYLCSAAAARVGAGIVACAAAPALQAVVASRLPEATYVPLPEGPPDQAGEAAFRAVAEGLPQWSALVVGPGLGRTPESARFLDLLLTERARRCPAQPHVLDAGALYHLARHAGWWARLGPSAILTPHHGEMARLVGMPTEAVSAEPWATARQVADARRVTIVLKGPHTVVAPPDAACAILPHANPALATGGTGDVLAGAIGGLAAQGAAPAAAAVAAVYVHAAAAHRLLATAGGDLLLASDLAPAMAAVLAELRSERGDASSSTWIPWAARL